MTTDPNERIIKRHEGADWHLNDDGDVILKEKGWKPDPHGDGMIRDTVKVNLTRLYQNPPRTSGDVSHLLIEAELYAETGYAGNPAHPVSDDVEERARDVIEGRDLTPAWEVDG